MTRPDRAAVVIAAFIAAAAAIALACGAPWAAVILAGLGLGALALFWHVPLCDDNGNDIEALAAAVREEHPRYRDWDIRELTDGRR